MMDLLQATSSRTWGVIVALAALTGCETVDGSGHVVSEEREIGEVDSVSLRGRGTIEFTQAPETELVIEAEDNIIGKIVSRVEDGKLILRQRENVILDPTRAIRYHLRAPSLSRIALDGGRFVSDAFEAPFLSLDLDGSSKAEISGMTVDDLSVKVDGSARLEVAGAVASQTVKVDGSGRYRARDLESVRAVLVVDGSGEATVHVTDYLDVEIDGSGHVDYLGSPEISRDVDASGKLHAID